MSPVALVTGAARGIGAATVDALVAAGWHVVAVDRCRDVEGIPYAMATPAELDAVVDRHPGRVLGLVGDARSAQDMALAVETAVAQFGSIDAAVASAGVIAGGASAVGDARRRLRRGAVRQPRRRASALLRGGARAPRGA